MSISSGAWSAEYIRSQNTAPTSIEKADTPIENAFQGGPGKGIGILQGTLGKRLKGYPAWLSDATLGFNIRAYDFKRVNQDDSINQALTPGGELGLTTGKFARVASIRLSYYYSGALYAPEGRGGTGLLTSDQQAISTLGKAYLQLGDMDKMGVRLYRQELNMPFMNTDDSRMVPNTHESYLLGRAGTDRNFGLGHITKIKTKSSEEFVPMSEAAGVPGTDEGVTIAGGNAKLANDVVLGGVNLYGWDTFNTTYIETSWVGPVMRKYGFKASAQYTDQRSVGDELLGSINTNALGLSLTGSRNGRMLTLAYTHSDDRGVLRSPWGGTPLYNSMMLESFNRAGEKALRFGLSWHGKPSGRHVWSGFANIVKGWNALDTGTGESLPDQSEFDLTLDYKFAKTRLASTLWLRFRGAYAEFEDDTRRWNARIILNYPLRIL